MTKQEMIDKIYEVIAYKTLNFGCRLKDTFREYYVGDEGRIYNIGGDGFQSGDIEDDSIDEMKIIGHPVMIGDVLDYVYEKRKTEDGELDEDMIRYLENIPLNWNYFRKSIEDQSEECITFIYNLIKDDTN